MNHLSLIGAIYPDDLWVDRDIERLLNEFRFFLPDRVEMVTARTSVPDQETDAAAGRWLAENGEIEEAARRLIPLRPSLDGEYLCVTRNYLRF